MRGSCYEGIAMEFIHFRLFARGKEVTFCDQLIFESRCNILDILILFLVFHVLLLLSFQKIYTLLGFTFNSSAQKPCERNGSF